jgi:hypothetical protein
MTIQGIGAFRAAIAAARLECSAACTSLGRRALRDDVVRLRPAARYERLAELGSGAPRGRLRRRKLNSPTTAGQIVRPGEAPFDHPALYAESEPRSLAAGDHRLEAASPERPGATPRRLVAFPPASVRRHREKPNSCGHVAPGEPTPGRTRPAVDPIQSILSRRRLPVTYEEHPPLLRPRPVFMHIERKMAHLAY